MNVALSGSTLERLNSIKISERPGGNQNLVRTIRAKVAQTGFNIELSKEEIDEIDRYSRYGKGNGGYQTLFREILLDARKNE